VLNNRIVAVAGMNHDTEPLYITELLRQQQLPAPEAVLAELALRIRNRCKTCVSKNIRYIKKELPQPGAAPFLEIGS
jgi:hypothetical protein